MDTQFRCKCGKPMSYANESCPDCGSLGPHVFMGKSSAPAESDDIPRSTRHRESYTPEYVERPHPAARPERYSIPPEDDVPVEPRHSTGIMNDNDDSRFPAGMRSHSPILDHIRNIDGEQKETKKRTEQARPHYHEGRIEHRSSYSDNDDAEEEHKKENKHESSNSGIVSTIISIVLVLALVIAAVYVINNYEEITKWLASPTVPEVFKPSAE